MIERFVKALSYPGSVALDFFAGSGTLGRVCVAEKRHCLLCDADRSTLSYFDKHLDLMRSLGQNADFRRMDDVPSFFAALEGERRA